MDLGCFNVAMPISHLIARDKNCDAEQLQMGASIFHQCMKTQLNLRLSCFKFVIQLKSSAQLCVGMHSQ